MPSQFLNDPQRNPHFSHFYVPPGEFAVFQDTEILRNVLETTHMYSISGDAKVFSSSNFWQQTHTIAESFVL